MNSNLKSALKKLNRSHFDKRIYRGKLTQPEALALIKIGWKLAYDKTGWILHTLKEEKSRGRIYLSYYEFIASSKLIKLLGRSSIG